MTNGNEAINYFEYNTADSFGDLHTSVNLGLTKREYFAAMFTQAYINNSQNGNPLDAHGNADAGIMQADILIKELNKTNK